MNVKSILASVSLLVAAGAAFAAEPAQQLTREQVIADTAAARAAGQLDQSEAAFDQQFRSAAASTVTRADVKAETIAARDAGELDRNEAYDDVSYMAPRARNASVKAQLAAKTVKGNSTQ
jgi:cytochrome c556